MLKKIFTILYKDYKIELVQSHLFFSLGLYLISSIYIIYISFQPFGIADMESWVSIFWIIILFGAITSISKSFFQESNKRNYYYYYLYSPDELILSKLIYNFVFLSLISLFTFGVYALLIGNVIVSTSFFLCLLVLGSFSISNCLTFVAAIGHQVKNNSIIISVLSFPIILPILLLLIKISKISSTEFSWNLVQDYIYLLILLNFILLALTKILFAFLWRN
tara:strand:+ start:1982 stop:2644 length:663 start_codon:yes stop_codon:yes gene_type:complete